MRSRLATLVLVAGLSGSTIGAATASPLSVTDGSHSRVADGALESNDTGSPPSCGTRCAAQEETTASDGRTGTGNSSSNSTGVGSPLGYSGGDTNFYQVGSFYKTGEPSFESTSVWTSLSVPSSGVVNGDQYSLLLSVYDSDGYYDQLGLASDYGCPSGCGNPTNTWTIAYEQGWWGSSDGLPAGCGNTGHFDRDVDEGDVSVNSWYTFEMRLTGTELIFNVYPGQDSLSDALWDYALTDSAAFFQVQPYVGSCYEEPSGQTGTFPSFTLYEEVDWIANGIQPFPQWDFSFDDTTISAPSMGTIEMGDSLFVNFVAGLDTPPSPHNYYVDRTEGTYEQTMANEADAFAFSDDSLSVAPGGVVTDTGYLYPVGGSSPTDHCVSHTCDITETCTGPSGWTLACELLLSVPKGYDLGSAYISVNPPSSTPPGEYYVGYTSTITNTSPTEEYTNFIFYVFVT